MKLNVSELIDTLQNTIVSELDSAWLEKCVMLGIHTGGAWIAERLHGRIHIKEPLGLLDISFYRDDFSRIGMHPSVKPSHLPLSIDNKNIILVDDVLYTGRTIRAALNEIFDYGRPATVLLAVLIEREGRELPIQADFVGQHLDLEGHQHVKINGPEPLSISFVEGATPPGVRK